MLKLELLKDLSPEELVQLIFDEINNLKSEMSLDDASKKKIASSNLEAQLLYQEWKQKRDKRIADNAVDPLQACGVINSAIGYGRNLQMIPYDAIDNFINFFDGFPERFGILLTSPIALLATLEMINRGLFTCSLAGKWFTTGQIPQWSHSVIDRNNGYNIGATVRYNGVMYESIIDNNKIVPSAGSLVRDDKWIISPLEFPIGRVIFSPSPTADRGFLLANGANISKTTYYNLWHYAFNKYIVVSVDEWNNGQQGLFADVDSDTFRIPDLRGLYLRGANAGSGRDPRRGDETGNLKSGNVLSHNHPASSPEHNHDASQDNHKHEYDADRGSYVLPHDGDTKVFAISYGARQTGGANPVPAVHIGNRAVTVNVGNTGADQNSVNDIAYTIQIKY